MNTELRALTDSEIEFISGGSEMSGGKASLVNINVDPIIDVPVFSFNGVGNTQVVGNQNLTVAGNILSFDKLDLGKSGGPGQL